MHFYLKAAVGACNFCVPSCTNTMPAIPLGVLVAINDQSYCLRSALTVVWCFSANQGQKSVTAPHMLLSDR